MTFIIIILAIAFQIYLSVKKVSPFISLLLVSVLSGLFPGMDPSALILNLVI
jgi:Gnt-I system high-affinity gluconate transporter